MGKDVPTIIQSIVFLSCSSVRSGHLTVTLQTVLCKMFMSYLRVSGRIANLALEVSFYSSILYL